MKLALKIVLAVVVLLVGALVVFLFTDWEAPVLGQKLVAIAARAAGIELEVDRVAVNLRKGLLLEGVVASSQAEGEVMTATIDLVQIECALISLIRGDILVQRILVESPRIEIVSRDLGGGWNDEAVSEEPPSKSTAATADELDIADRPKPATIDELSITDAYLISRTEGADASETVIESLDFRLIDFVLDAAAPSAALGVTGSGRLRASGMRFDDRAIGGVRARLEADDGLYLLSDVEVSAGQSGEIEVERVELDLGQDPYRYRVTASARDLDLNAFLTDIDAVGLGSASLSLDAAGEGPGLAGAVVEMVIELADGTLPSVELLSSIDRFLGTSLDSAPYQGTEIRLSLVEGLLEIEPFELVSGVAKLGIAGTVELDGEIDLKVPVGLPREVFQREDVSEEVLDALTSRDWMTIPLAVTGTVDDPRFGPDMDAVRELTRRLADSAKDAARTRIRSELQGVINRRVPPLVTDAQ
jgi:hypothetical protein